MENEWLPKVAPYMPFFLRLIMWAYKRRERVLERVRELRYGSRAPSARAIIDNEYKFEDIKLADAGTPLTKKLAESGYVGRSYHPSDRELLQFYSDDYMIGVGQTLLPYVEVENYVKEPHKYSRLKAEFGNPYNIASHIRDYCDILLTRYELLQKSGQIRFWAGPIVSLANFDNNNGTLTLRPAKYTDQMTTNMALQLPFRDVINHDIELKNRPVARNLRQLDCDELYIEKARKLKPFGASVLVNSVGICAMVLSSDEYFMVPHRVHWVVREAGLRTVSVGHALKWDDSIREAHLTRYLEERLRAEAKQELGLTKNDIKEIIPLAFCRELDRGGKPQFFYLIITNDRRNSQEIVSKSQDAQIRKPSQKTEYAGISWFPLRNPSMEDSLMGFLRWPSRKLKLSTEMKANLLYAFEYLHQNL